MIVKQFELELFGSAADDACDLIKALAHPARLRIVCALSGHECCVTSLAEIAAVPITTISRHLALLRKDRIVKTRRARQTVFYSLNDENVGKFVDILAETFCAVAPPNAKRRKV
jgi:ArsR family transcriptional regulator, virulence genes transcriptional regulator